MSVGKIQPTHCDRLAYVYVRQSTPGQVLENRESTERQYQLQARAIALGWSSTRVEIIDEDQGRSGSTAAHRTGFQRLVSDVGLGRVGIVLMLEASRLARNNSDWYRLIEICGVSATLIADEGAVYNPRDPNDRLLLGVKGTISEAELFTLRTRLYEGRWNKARKGTASVSVADGLRAGALTASGNSIPTRRCASASATSSNCFAAKGSRGASCAISRRTGWNCRRVSWPRTATAP